MLKVEARHLTFHFDGRYYLICYDTTLVIKFSARNISFKSGISKVFCFHKSNQIPSSYELNKYCYSLVVINGGYLKNGNHTSKNMFTHLQNLTEMFLHEMFFRVHCICPNVVCHHNTDTVGGKMKI